MKMTDGRKLSHDQLEYIRTQAVRAVEKDKRSPEEVIITFGLHRSNIYKWLKLYKEGGWKALLSKKSKGRQPIITDKEKKVISKLLIKDPQQLQFDFALWTLDMVKDLIKRKFKKDVSIWTVSRILKSIGFTKQKPLFRAYQQDASKVGIWLSEEYPAIEKEAKKERREIYFEDEAGFSSTDHRGKTWGIKGQTPIVRVTGKRYGISSISVVNKKGKMKFMLYNKSFTSTLFIDFIKRLMKNNKCPITLIVDGHPVHKSVAVRGFIAATKGKVKLYFLPPYSPELNPDEQVWNHAKSIVTKKTKVGSDGLITMVKKTMHSIQKNVGLVKSFFRHPDVAYAM
jgi:transposase